MYVLSYLAYPSKFRGLLFWCLCCLNSLVATTNSPVEPLATWELFVGKLKLCFYTVFAYNARMPSFTELLIMAHGIGILLPLYFPGLIGMDPNSDDEADK